MAKKKKMCASGIGGQAVLEGVMMKNKQRLMQILEYMESGQNIEMLPLKKLKKI